MKPRVTLITIGVDDLERSLRFYRDGLGLSTDGIVGQEFQHGSVVFIDLESGLRLALWPRSSLAHDTGLPVGPTSATEFTLAHNVSSKQEVDVVMGEAKKAGAVIVKPPHDTFYGGYAGYFQDPDGHLWEVAWNPQWNPAARKRTETTPQLLSDENHRNAATLAFAMLRFECGAVPADHFTHPPGTPRLGDDAYVFLPSLRRIPESEVVSFLASLHSPALLAPTTVRGIVALTLTSELSGERANGARKIFANQRATIEWCAGQIAVTPETKVLLSLFGEEHIFSFENVREWSERFAVHVGWNVSPFAGDNGVAARFALVRSDGTKT